jgi:hypothetical protein
MVAAHINKTHRNAGYLSMVTISVKKKLFELQAANSQVIRHDHNANSPHPNILLFMIA